MVRHKPSKDKKKGSQLVIRVDKAERDAFVALCDRLDTSAAREIRRFMRERVAAHAAPADARSPDNALPVAASPQTAGRSPAISTRATAANSPAKPSKRRTPQTAASLTAED